LVLPNQTRKLKDSETPNERFGGGDSRLEKRLYLHLQDSSDVLTLDLDEAGEYLIGRYDAQTQRSPEIDLTAYQAADKGVSRAHAKLTYHDHTLRIIDLGSANFTYLNNQKLVANQARIVRDGDEIRFGHLVVNIQFGEYEDSVRIAVRP
jgi:pSer/pThr/pTyr-binding forkhead associated (FHA) protein